jgi:predicted secreted protein
MPSEREQIFPQKAPAELRARRNIQIAGGVIVVLAIAAILLTVWPKNQPNAAEFEISNPSKIIEVREGEDFTISVETNLPSDYHWEVAEELDANIVAYVWKDQVPPEPGNPNATGRDVWHFKAVAPGETTITLGYYQGITLYAAEKSVFTIVVK